MEAWLEKLKSENVRKILHFDLEVIAYSHYMIRSVVWCGMDLRHCCTRGIVWEMNKV